MDLIITEKRTAGEKVASCIVGEHFVKGDGFLQGKNYYITWCAGHLYALLDIEEYDPNYNPDEKAKWTMNNLPFCPNKFRYKISQPKDNPAMCKTKKKQVRVIKALINDPSVQNIYHCGDADREGEVIVRDAIRALLKTRKPVYRIWLNSYAKGSVMKALQAKEPDSNFDGWDNAGIARAREDWLFGINGTRYLTVKSGTLLPWGRCKYIITKTIVDREREIKQFVPTDYYAVCSKTDYNGFEIALTSKKTFDISDLPAASALAEKYNASGAVVYNIEKEREVVSAGKLFSTTELQSFVASHYKDTDPKDVENALEELYQNGYLTYPRTNSQFLTTNDESDVNSTIEALQAAGYAHLVNKVGNKNIYNDSKVDGHSALMPVSNLPDENKLTDVQRIVYQSVRNRFLAVFCSEDTLVDKTTVTFLCCEEEFNIVGTETIEPGWRQYEPATAKDRKLPDFQKGQSVPVNFIPTKKTTTPPKRFTVASFGTWCNAPWRKEEDLDKKDYTDEEWKGILHEATICTDATRTPTITECRNIGYIKLSHGTYSATEKGMLFVDVCEKLGLTFTVKEVMDLSMMLFDVRKSALGIDDCIRAANEKLVDMFKNRDVEIENDFASLEMLCKCPKCGGNIIEGKDFFKCTTKGCPAIIWKHSNLLPKLGGKKKSFSRKDALLFFSGKPVSVKGCVSQKTGKQYDCLLYLDLTGDKAMMKIGFDSPAGETGKVVGPCPVCGKDMLEHDKRYTCSDKNCGFTLWKESKRYNDILKITLTKAKALLAGKGVEFTITDSKGNKKDTKLLLSVREYNGKMYPAFVYPAKH